MISEQLLFVEHADKENRHLSEELLYNEQVESLQPSERWTKQHQKAYLENSFDLYPAQLEFIRSWVGARVAEVT